LWELCVNEHATTSTSTSTSTSTFTLTITMEWQIKKRGEKLSSRCNQQFFPDPPGICEIFAAICFMQYLHYDYCDYHYYASNRINFKLALQNGCIFLRFLLGFSSILSIFLLDFFPTSDSWAKKKETDKKSSQELTHKILTEGVGPRPPRSASELWLP